MTARKVFRKGIGLVAVLALLLLASCDSFMGNSSNNPHPPAISDLVINNPVVRLESYMVFSFSFFDDGGDIEEWYATDSASSTTMRNLSPT